MNANRWRDHSRRDVNENRSLGIDRSYHRRCVRSIKRSAIQRELNYAIHVREGNSRIRPGSLLTPIDRFQSFNFCAQMNCLAAAARKAESAVRQT